MSAGVKIHDATGNIRYAADGREKPMTNYPPLHPPEMNAQKRFSVISFLGGRGGSSS